jgi:hypothetical protein
MLIQNQAGIEELLPLPPFLKGKIVLLIPIGFGSVTYSNLHPV